MLTKPKPIGPYLGSPSCGVRQQAPFGGNINLKATKSSEQLLTSRSRTTEQFTNSVHIHVPNTVHELVPNTVHEHVPNSVHEHVPNTSF